MVFHVLYMPHGLSPLGFENWETTSQLVKNLPRSNLSCLWALACVGHHMFAISSVG